MSCGARPCRGRHSGLFVLYSNIYFLRLLAAALAGSNLSRFPFCSVQVGEFIANWPRARLELGQFESAGSSRESKVTSRERENINYQPAKCSDENGRD